MGDTRADSVFSVSVSELYDTYLVPLIFDPYAADLVARLPMAGVSRVLEIAAGTGVVTRVLASTLPSAVSIVATDLNDAMLARAATVGTSRPVEWRQADAMHLPFADESFDVVVCQFGVMFFPDKPQAFAEARRVLRRDGVLAFNVWDRIEDNEFAETVTTALRAEFPDDPPRFLARTPHGYHDPATIRRDLAAAGFTSTADISTVTRRSCATSARVPAVAYCQGTPLRGEIEARAPARLDQLTDVAHAALVRQFGAGAVDGRIQAHVVTIAR